MPQHTGVQGVPLPVLRGSGEIGIPRRVRAAPGAFGTFLAEKYTSPFFEKKEAKKLYNGKLRFPKGINLADSYQNHSAKRSFA